MKKDTINKKEIDKFSKLADEWWNPNGKFAPIHRFNPIRIKFIKETLMAEKFSHFVLNNRKLFIFLILIYTLFMGYKGLEVEYNYDFSQTVPDTDEDMMYYNSFKETFGEDGNVFAIGLKD